LPHSQRRALILCAIAGCGGCQGGPPFAHRATISQGVPDPGDPAVLAILDGEHVACTGAVIAERIVLTAAHCLSDVTRPPRVLIGERVIGAEAWSLHPAYDSSREDGHDLALVLLASTADVPAVSLAPPGAIETVGEVVRIVGFGHTAAEGAGDHVKRKGWAQIGAVAARVFTTRPGPGQACEGDSGGPAFAQTPEGERVIGIVSRGSLACDGEALYTRVDAYADFLAAFVLLAGAHALPFGSACLTSGQCASGRCGTRVGLRACAEPCEQAPCMSDGSCVPSSDDRRWCVPADAGGFGASCDLGSGCATGLCVRLAGHEGRSCTVRCSPRGLPCADGLVCERDLDTPDEAPRFACAPAPAIGCSAASGPATPDWPGLAIGLIAIVLQARRGRVPRGRHGECQGSLAGRPVPGRARRPGLREWLVQQLAHDVDQDPGATPGHHRAGPRLHLRRGRRVR
jgi:hypothetical protein